MVQNIPLNFLVSDYEFLGTWEFRESSFFREYVKPARNKQADFFRTTHRVKTQEVTRSRGQWCGDIELAAYLANAVGPVPLMLDLRIAHERFGSSSDPSINGHWHYPHDLDSPQNESTTEKIRQYRADHTKKYVNNVSI